jgi:signal peptidase I
MLWLKRHLGAVLSVGFVLAILPSYVWAYAIRGASEAPTILMGDTVIVNRAAYDFRAPYSRIAIFHSGSPQRGDMALAYLPSGIGLAIKRVIGLPGEMIEVRENCVIVDGRPLPVRPLDGAAFERVPAAHRMGSTVVMEDGHWAAYTPGRSRYRDSAPVQLGPGEYFLIGDNRDNSLDSRAFGPVSRDRIVGKVIAVLQAGPRVAKRD